MGGAKGVGVSGGVCVGWSHLRCEWQGCPHTDWAPFCSCLLLSPVSLCPTWRSLPRILCCGLSVITPSSVISQASGDTFERPFHNDTCPFCCLCDRFLSGPGHTPRLGPAWERTCQNPQVGFCGFWLLFLFPLKMGTSLLFSDMCISNTRDRFSTRK